jgi:hypothetical protein
MDIFRTKLKKIIEKITQRKAAKPYGLIHLIVLGAMFIVCYIILPLVG